MTNYDDLFQTWIREKEILDRCSARTIDSYRDAWNAYKRYEGCTCEMAICGVVSLRDANKNVCVDEVRHSVINRDRNRCLLECRSS
jgi:hypothetical protein